MAEIRVLQTIVALEGGVAKVITDYCQNMDRSKVNFDYVIYTDKNDIFSEKIKELGGKIYLLDFPKIKNPIKKQLVKYKSHYRLFREYKDHIIQVNASTYTDRFIAVLAKKAGAKHVVIEAHSTKKPHESFIRKVSELFFAAISHRRLDCYLAVSEKAAEYLFPKKILREKKYSIVKNGIDTEKFRFDAETRNKYRAEMKLEDKFVMFHAGRFDYVKNHERLLEIFAEVHKKAENSVLLLAGAGELMPQVKKQAESLGIAEYVDFLGSRSDIPELMCGADVFVMPSKYEGMPLTVNEAQAASLSVVCSEAIPQSADFTGLVTRLPLSADNGIWAEKIISAGKTPRRDMSEIVRKSGFDIKQNGMEMQKLYENKSF